MLSLELVLLLAVLTRIWSSVPWNVAETKPSQTRVPACPWHASSPFIALSHTILQQGPSHGGAQANRQSWLLGHTGSCSCPSLTEKRIDCASEVTTTFPHQWPNLPIRKWEIYLCIHFHAYILVFKENLKSLPWETFPNVLVNHGHFCYSWTKQGISLRYTVFFVSIWWVILKS